MDMKKGLKALNDFGITKTAIASMFGTNTKMLERISDAPKGTYSLVKNMQTESEDETMKVGTGL